MSEVGVFLAFRARKVFLCLHRLPLLAFDHLTEGEDLGLWVLGLGEEEVEMPLLAASASEVVFHPGTGGHGFEDHFEIERFDWVGGFHGVKIGSCELSRFDLKSIIDCVQLTKFNRYLPNFYRHVKYTYR